MNSADSLLQVSTQFSPPAGCCCPYLPLSPAALHVAAATGRADIVRQLVAAGASASKALPMDYRTLLKQHPDMLAPEQAQQAQHAQQAAAAGLGAEAAAFSAMAASRWGQEQAGQGEGRAPPPKRGRYVTVGPPAIGAPSLQYCTALHLAALNGQLEVVHTLLATGQVSRLCCAVLHAEWHVPDAACSGAHTPTDACPHLNLPARCLPACHLCLPAVRRECQEH